MLQKHQKKPGINTFLKKTRSLHLFSSVKRNQRSLVFLVKSQRRWDNNLQAEKTNPFRIGSHFGISRSRFLEAARLKNASRSFKRARRFLMKTSLSATLVRKNAIWPRPSGLQSSFLYAVKFTVITIFLRISRIPKVLLLHLKRFSSKSKDSSLIKFPVSSPLLLDSSKFQLSSVINHEGKSTSSGHYVASVKDNGNWFSISDEKVSALESVLSEKAYVLFYTTC